MSMTLDATLEWAARRLGAFSFALAEERFRSDGTEVTLDCPDGGAHECDLCAELAHISTALDKIRAKTDENQEPAT
jgi:hypothetical protein